MADTTAFGKAHPTTIESRGFRVLFVPLNGGA
jgi:hypothetical protein